MFKKNITYLGKAHLKKTPIFGPQGQQGGGSGKMPTSLTDFRW